MKTNLHSLSICSVYGRQICRRLYLSKKLSNKLSPFPPLLAAFVAINWINPGHSVLVPFGITTATIVSEKILVPRIAKIKTSLKRRGQILRVAQLGVFGLSSALVFGGLAYKAGNNIQDNNAHRIPEAVTGMQKLEGEMCSFFVCRPGSQTKSVLSIPHQ